MGDDKRQVITVPLLSILLSLIVSGIIIMLLGKNPLEVYVNLLRGSGLLPKENYATYKSMLTDFTSFVNIWTPMIFVALAVSFSFSAGLFNIGAAGQMLTAGFITSVTVGYSTLASPIAKPLALLIGLLVGALVGGLIGWLKYKFNIHEVVSSIMLNYIAQYIVSFFINAYFVDPISRQSRAISEQSRLTLMSVPVGNLKMDIPLGIILAIIMVFIIRFVINKTTLGYEIKSVGLNTRASKYAGIKTGKILILSMLISGGLAGISGVTYYMGYVGTIQPEVLPSIGFDAIAVTMLANKSPIGIIFASFLVTIISKGGTYMSSASGLPVEIAPLITGILLLFSSCGIYIRYVVKNMSQNIGKDESGGK